MKELCNSNEFYQMQEYSEWNNSLEAFEQHASCQFYKYKYVINDDNSLGLPTDRDIIFNILWATKQYGSITDKVKDGYVKVTDEETSERYDITVEEIISDYKIGPVE